MNLFGSTQLLFCGTLAAAFGVLPGQAGAQSDSAEVARAGWSSFEARFGPGLVPTFAEHGFEARGRVALGFDPARPGELDRAAVGLREALEELMGLELRSLVELRRIELADTRVLFFEQRLRGVPILESRVELRLSRTGELVHLRAQGVRRNDAPVDFALERRDAGELARFALPDQSTDALWASGMRRVWSADEGGELRPVWQVDVWDPARTWATWKVTVDGVDGSIRRVESGVLEGISGSVDGRGMLSGPQTAGSPTTLPMTDAFVAAIDRAAAFERITTDTCEELQAAISSDGTRIAWVSECDGDSEIWTALADGTGAIALTANADEDHSPVLSGDGTRLVFVSDRDGDLELFSISTDGSGLAQLTANSVADSAPSLSGDGLRAVYVSGSGSGSEILTLLVDAPAPMQLTSDSTADAAPRISVDGTRIAWVSWRDGDAEVFSMDPAGGSLVQLTLNSVEDREPDLQGDGSRVVFTSRLAAQGQLPTDPSFTLPNWPGSKTRRLRPNFDLFEAASDGSSVSRLTFTEEDESEPSIAADGGCVVYVVTGASASDLEGLDLASHARVPMTADASPDRGPRVASTCAQGVWLAHDGDREVFAWSTSGPGIFLTTTTDTAGAYSLPFPDGASPSVETSVTGAWARVVDLDPRWNEERALASAGAPATGVDLHLNSSGSEEGPTAQVTAYSHVSYAHTALETIVSRAPLSMPGPLPIDEQLLVRADFPEPVANAFYSPAQRETTFFIGAGPARPNTAYDTVVYHEYGHYVDDLTGGIAGASACEAAFALSEGIGDIVATYLSGSAVVAEDFFGSGTWIRNYGVFPWSAPLGAKGRQYDGKDCATLGGKPKVHEHGQAFAGFAWDLRASLGAVTAENLLFGAIFSNPSTMQEAVTETFFLASTPAFGGSGDLATSPLAPAICVAAAKHGFDCPPRADHGSQGCLFASCGSTPAIHRVIGTEWLGVFIDPETDCEPSPNFDDDGVFVPPHLGEGTSPPLSVTLSVDPALRFSGRYGAPASATWPQLEERRVFLNGWLFIDEGGAGFVPHKVFGTGTPSGTLAYNPDTWSSSSITLPLTFTVPAVSVTSLGILRVRVDYGEDAGRIKTCLSDSTLMGACGVARFGEVEDYQVAVIDGGS